MRKLVLFDFDGTLADTAPDLTIAANKIRTVRGLSPMEFDYLRPYASQGARGLLKATLDMEKEDPDYDTVRLEFLSYYEECMTDTTHLFDGIAQLLQDLKQNGYEWGIVTNKAENLAIPQSKFLGIYDDAVTLVGGDTTPYLKPNPASLFYALKQANIDVKQCIYVGDDERDVQAAHAAGMKAMAAGYGYCGIPSSELHKWNAEYIAITPQEIWPKVQQWAKDENLI